MVVVVVVVLVLEVVVVVVVYQNLKFLHCNALPSVITLVVEHLLCTEKCARKPGKWSSNWLCDINNNSIICITRHNVFHRIITS